MFGLFGITTSKPTYSIIQMRGGYVAVFHERSFRWAIKGDGSDGISVTDVNGREGEYVCDSEEEAGRRVNLHSEQYNGKTVWEGG